MPDVEDDNDEALLIDLVENAPLPGEASTVDAGELFAERSAHALRIREQWPCDQFDGCDCHVMRQQFDVNRDQTRFTSSSPAITRQWGAAEDAGFEPARA
jgi:hypothetical protein